MSFMKYGWLSAFLFNFAYKPFNQHATAKYEFSVKQCVDYAEKNSAIVKNALLDINFRNSKTVQ